VKNKYGTASTPRYAACLLIDNEVYANLAEGAEPVPESQDDEEYVDIASREKGIFVKILDLDCDSNAKNPGRVSRATPLPYLGWMNICSRALWEFWRDLGC